MAKNIKSKRKKGSTTIVHPTKKKTSKQTDGHTFISIGKSEKSLLQHLLNLNNSRFNLTAYSRTKGKSRSSLYHTLNTLLRKGLIEKPHLGQHTITNKGINTLDASNGGVQSLRGGCRDGQTNLSMHYAKFVLTVVNRNDFSPSLIKSVNPNKWKRLDLKNLQQYYIYFDDATIVINPKKIIIRVHDIVDQDVDECTFQNINIALKYITVIEKLRIEVSGFALENAHYARVKSVLSDFLSKIDNRYYLDLGDGKKFWIDNSCKQGEDETNDASVRDRIDTFLQDVINSESLISDLDKMKGVVSGMIKLHALNIQSNKQPIINSGLPTYIG